MELTKGQQEGLEMARRLVRAPGYRVGVLAGLAGTGKSWLLKTIAEELGTPVVIAPTGKAAARVKQISGLGAMTAHRWQYKPITDPKTGRTSFQRLPHELLPRGESGLLVIDEASMVGEDLWVDICDNAALLGLRILCIGDPFQLPPVENEGGNSFSCLDPRGANEYVLMQEVLRQAQESPIIRASMLIRCGDVMAALALLPQIPPKDFIDQGARLASRGCISICHRNTTRHWANAEIRKARNLSDDAVAPGEPLVVLKNNYNLQVFNGETYVFQDWQELSPSRHSIYDRWQKIKEDSRFGVATLVDAERSLDFRAVLAQEELWGRLRASVAAIAATAEILHKDVPALHANFGYCLTAHKSQGSEWNEVLVGLEPSIRFWGRDREQSLRWLYTASTRAREQCYISLGVTAP